MLVALLMALPALRVQAEPASDPAGFYRITCLGNSDTIVSIPFARPAAANVVVDSVAENVVTVKGTPGWTEDQFVYAAGTQPNTYYLRFLSGAKEGSYYPVTANGTDSLTLSLGGDDILTVADGDRAAVIPYWTLGTAFPAGRGVHSVGGDLVTKTEILIPDLDGEGINLSARDTFFYYKPDSNEGTWYSFSAFGQSQNDYVLLPDAYFIVRHNIADPTTFTAKGSVPTSDLTTLVVASPTVKQDNFLSLARPVPVSLDASGLLGGGFLPSNDLYNPEGGDQLLVFNNQQTARNKSAAATYYYAEGAWRNQSAILEDSGGDAVFQPGTGVIVRKKAISNGGGTGFWVNPRSSLLPPE